jgi:hypothetical protein
MDRFDHPFDEVVMGPGIGFDQVPRSPLNSVHNQQYTAKSSDLRDQLRKHPAPAALTALSVVPDPIGSIFTVFSFAVSPHGSSSPMPSSHSWIQRHTPRTGHRIEEWAAPFVASSDDPLSLGALAAECWCRIRIIVI